VVQQYLIRDAIVHSAWANNAW